MATWFTITYEGEPTEDDYARVSELAAQGFTSGQLINDPVPGSPEWDAGVPTKREIAAGVDDNAVSLTEYLSNLKEGA
jgi:hypothetical protein